MAHFIELTALDNKKFIGNVDLLLQVAKAKNGNAIVVGWNNNGGFQVKETYEEVLNIIDASHENIRNIKYLKNN
jgi:hypothetical protein